MPPRLKDHLAALMVALLGLLLCSVPCLIGAAFAVKF